MHRSTLQIVADALRGDEQAAERVIAALAAHGLLRTDGPSATDLSAGERWHARYDGRWHEAAQANWEA